MSAPTDFSDVTERRGRLSLPQVIGLLADIIFLTTPVPYA